MEFGEGPLGAAWRAWYSIKDKRAVGKKIPLVVKAVEEMVKEHCARIAETEPELEGQMPEEYRKVAEKVSLEDHLRLTVRTTKKCIADRIRNTEIK